MKNKPAAFAVLDEVSNKYNETKDCTVKAVALATGVSYEEAHNAMWAQGRKFRQGAHGTRKAIESLGFKCIPTTLFGRTIMNVHFPMHSTYLVYTSGHVLVAKDGEVQDWTNGRQHRPISFYRVVRDEKAFVMEYPKTIPQSHITPTRKPRTKELYKWALMLGGDDGESNMEIIGLHKRQRKDMGERWVKGRYAETKGKLYYIPVWEAMSSDRTTNSHVFNRCEDQIDWDFRAY